MSPATATSDCEVLVIGAGLAGLQCARTLGRAGLDVVVWEAADEVGGRIRTDEVDGFRVDRGFQVLNPAYPAVRQHIDLPSLQMRYFGAGAQVRTSGGMTVLANPLREPQYLGDLLTSGYLNPGQLLALMRWAGPALGRPHHLVRSADRSTTRAMDDAGLTGQLRDVVQAFLTGVVLENNGSTSVNFVRLLLRMFILGVPGVPRDGMQVLPEQIAAQLSVPVRTGMGVTAIEQNRGSAVVRTAELSVTARLVVVATGAPAAQELLGVHVPRMKGVVTDWFTMPDPPSTTNFLTLDGRREPRGPVHNTAVLTNAAPSYAPAGRHLVQASSLLHNGIAPTVTEVLQHTGELYGAPTNHWELVRRHVVPHALPVQPVPLRTRRPMRVSDSVIMAGDHMDTASIQGALVSGERAAQGWLRRLSRAQPR